MKFLKATVKFSIADTDTADSLEEAVSIYDFKTDFTALTFLYTANPMGDLILELDNLTDEDLNGVLRDMLHSEYDNLPKELKE